MGAAICPKSDGWPDKSPFRLSLKELVEGGLVARPNNICKSKGCHEQGFRLQGFRTETGRRDDLP